MKYVDPVRTPEEAQAALQATARHFAELEASAPRCARGDFVAQRVLPGWVGRVIKDVELDVRTGQAGRRFVLVRWQRGPDRVVQGEAVVSRMWVGDLVAPVEAEAAA